MEKLINQKKSGQSLVEMVVAVSISALIIVALLIGAVIGTRNVQFSRNQSRAMELNRELSEWLRAEKKSGWSRLWSYGSGGEGITYCFSDLSFGQASSCSALDLEGIKIDGKFFREGVLKQEGVDKLKITITTSWQDPMGEHNETITTYLTKY
ncbi:MAG: transmembrane(s)proteins 13..35 [Microgenomates bacterium 39_7]|nr:MAG: transmembrane(s)proteins 13..35 [Microgenomates bacterium 39_7]